MNLNHLKAVLMSLNFEQKKEVFSKKFVDGDYSLKVDFDKKKIIYPEDAGLKINERQTCNFSSNENFVVFECVHRLLEKGYKPEHIELEPKWKLGHGASGGRADILVKNHQNQPFLIIECKTFDREFNKAWKDTLEDGGQLFSYVEQEKSVEFVCLYASQWNEADQRIDNQQRIISVKDNPIILKNLPDALNYSNAKNVKERFKVWKDTYQLEATEKGIFEDNIQAYQIGKHKYTLAIDTQPINSMNIKGKYHEFRTILRKHNVSRRENAFEVLVNLFLCKIVDETQNPEDLHFYWKGIAYDSYFDLVDRLQQLYKVGMQKFLQQDIVYVSQDDINNAFGWIKQKPNATEQRIKELFQQLKFYKGLDFEFIKVSNKDKFDKNAKILIEVIQMWQGLRLSSTEENQFLGDMFEFFLDNGIKQSEGQFFTPIPICKFIVNALPLESMLKRPEPLKVIDYACGSGHFLNEYAAQAAKLVKSIKGIDYPQAYYAQTYGIEKEDRLAKVSKVASFMYGHNDIQIIDADALTQQPDIQNESFDALIANPPFAVEGFLSMLAESDREQFILSQDAKINTDSIQCFFLERAKHLLNKNGVMGVIVPDTVLTKDGLSRGTREILLKYFDFISIVELRRGTFGQTGQETVILFLKRKTPLPEPAQHYQYRIENFFSDWKYEKQQSGSLYQDLHYIADYCALIDIELALYESVLLNQYHPELLNHPLFQQYQKEMPASKAKSEADEQAAFMKYVRSKEQERVYYFILSQQQSADGMAQPVLVVKGPDEHKDYKKFLGYEWVGRRGTEGIKYSGGDSVNNIQTPLFDPLDRDNQQKISYFIRQSFEGKQLDIPEELQGYLSYRHLHDMLDFNSKDFIRTKSLNMNQQEVIQLSSSHPMRLVGDVLLKNKEAPSKVKQIPANQILTEGLYPVVTQEKDKLISGYTNDESTLIHQPSVIFGDHTCSFKYIDFGFARGADGTQLLQVDPKELNLKYFYFILHVVDIDNRRKYERHFKYLKAKFIPIPTRELQQKAVELCENVQVDYEVSRMEMSTYIDKLRTVFVELGIINV